MTSTEIRYNVRYNENLLEDYYAEKRELERQLDELEHLKEKFSSLQNNFSNRQGERQQRLATFGGSVINNKIFSAYCSGMFELLSGNSFNNAYEGLNTAKGKITKKIQELLWALDVCENNISYRNQRKAYWQMELRKALIREEN